MDINSLTIGQAKELAAMFGGSASNAAPPPSAHVGKKCIVRTYASGVFFATVVSHHGRQIEMQNARRLWRFDCKNGIECTAVAMHGSGGERARICETVPAMTVLDALEIIPCSPVAIAQIEAAPAAEPK